MAMLAGMVARRRAGTKQAGRAVALALALALLAQVALTLPASAGALDRAASSIGECVCPDAAEAPSDDDGASVPDAPPDRAGCEQCQCCATSGVAVWLAAHWLPTVLGSRAHTVTEGVEPSTADPPRISKPPERSPR